MASKNLISWLQETYAESPSESLPVLEVLDTVNQNFPKITDKRAVGRYLKTIFPNIRTMQRRIRNDWTQKIYVYKGLMKRDTTVKDINAITLDKIPEILPPGFFVMQRSEKHVKFAKCTDIICNGNSVLLEVNMLDNGVTDIVVSGKSVTSYTGLPSMITMNRNCLDNFMTGLKQVKFCEGVIIKKPALYMKENVVIQQNNTGQKCLYSLSCQKVLPFTSYSSTTACCKCRTAGRVSPETHPLPATNNDPTATASSPVDVLSILRDNAPYLSETQLNLIKSQLDNSGIEKHSRRWDQNIIQLCLSLWTRSPQTYKQLIDSTVLLLPSVSTLSRYKNSVDQDAGINPDVFQWMYMEARHRDIPAHGFYGGLILDEMSIQEDMQIVKKAGKIKLVGFSDCGDSSTYALSNHVLQYIFHGFTGFRFPVAHYPTNQANASQLYSTFWDVIAALEEWGFHCLYVSMDGASTNRTFIKSHFEGPPTSSSMTAENIYSEDPLFFLSDPSHLFKKIRNNLLKSGDQKWHSRELFFNGKPIVWKMWVDCYQWDKAHGLSIHHRLSSEHMYPNKADVMRNHLAEEVLNSDMLNVMRCYQQHLGASGSILDSAISLLEQTSMLLNIFHDRRPITDLADIRFTQLKHVQTWFNEWEKDALSSQMMSWETREDLNFLVTGFVALATHAITKLHIGITPHFINSDIVENHFSQQRGLYHGSSANPNYNQYRSATNSIILGQNTISNKANASMRKRSKTDSALPFSSLCKKLRL